MNVPQFKFSASPNVEKLLNYKNFSYDTFVRFIRSVAKQQTASPCYMQPWSGKVVILFPEEFSQFADDATAHPERAEDIVFGWTVDLDVTVELRDRKKVQFTPLSVNSIEEFPQEHWASLPGDYARQRNEAAGAQGDDDDVGGKRKRRSAKPKEAEDFHLWFSNGSLRKSCALVTRDDVMKGGFRRAILAERKSIRTSSGGSML
jgi:hypothetical protein